MDKLKEKLSSFWTWQIAGWALYAIAIYVTFLSVAPEGAMFRLLRLKLFRAVVGFSLTCLMRLIYRYFLSRYEVWFVTLMVVVSSLLFATVWTFIENVYLYLWTAGFEAEAALGKAPRVVLDYAMTLLAWSALYFGIKYWQALQAERERALEAKALAHQAQLEMLRYQLNPHFLFNALNSIRASIDEDSRRAKQMITEFSEFLRYVLLNPNAASVPLRDEIEAAKNYLAIEKLRFEDRLDVTFNIEPEAESRPVPAFLLHPLVENAVKHGMMNGAPPLQLRISAYRSAGSLHLEVANTGELAGLRNGTGIGLKNIRQRLAQHFPGRSRFHLTEDGGWIRAVIEIEEG